MSKSLQWLLVGVLASLACLWGALAPAQQPPASAPSTFDHLATGFALEGVHATSRCESCHVDAIFKGTPRDCESCHVAGNKLARNNVVKNVDHITTTQSCASCHTTRRFAGARMNHAGIARGSCFGCHNGQQASGKPPTHLTTTASCDSCHSTSGWRPATGFDHAGVAPGSCATCHNGVRATGPGAAHVPFAQVATTAAASCDNCHRGGFGSWLPAKVHANFTIVAQCSNCHLGVRPTTPVHAGQTLCESCHKSTSTWSGARVDHSGFTAATQCAGCHNGVAATGKNPTHIPAGATNCASCHSTTAWKPTTFNHTQVPASGQCSTCHSGANPPADGPIAGHVPYQLVAILAPLNCDACHKPSSYTTWANGKVHANATVTAQCSVCHLAVRPTTSVHTGQTQCENCHKSTTAWTGARVDHSTFTAATNCSSCHNGVAATGKNPTHIPVAATNCYSCHSTTAWKPTKFNHTQMPASGQCATCHSGAYPPADGRSTTHTPYQLVTTLAALNCDACHKAGYTSWTGGRLHANVTVTTQCSSCHLAVRPTTAVHVGQTACEGCHKSTTTWTGARIDHSTFTAATQCVGCHNGVAATGKNPTHIPVGATNCYSCHSTSAWKPTKFNHTQMPASGQCATCHSGAYPPADGRNAGHVPYQLIATLASLNCDACHKAGFTSWAGGRLHANASVTGQCKTCHNGSYVAGGAVGKPANHIPEAQLLNGTTMECNACHSSTTSWVERMNHNNSMGGGAGWCKGCHLTGTNYLGKMKRMQLTHQKKTPPAIDCSESGCHRPLGNKGSTYTQWD